ncbi:MAG: ATP-binding protein, partial [Cyanobacteria bacterium P01_F01_bin.116]
LGLQWQAAYTHEQAVIQNQFSENAIYLDSIVKAVVDQLHILQVSAEDGLAKLSDKPTETVSLKAFDKDGKPRYRLTSVPNADTQINLQGVGRLAKLNDELKQEVQMAIGLMPGFRSVKENLEEVTWAYYISAREFFNLYPYDETVDYQHDMLELQFFTQALPQNNPQRQTSWTDAYLDLGGQGMMVTADAPVYDEGQFRGVVALDITLQRLNQVIQNFDYPDGKILITDANQQLLAFPNLTTTDVENVQTLDDVLPFKLQGEIGHVLSGSEHPLEIIDSFLVMHQAIQNTPWHLVFYVPQRGIYLKIFTNSLLASLIPLAGLGLCLLVTNRLFNYGFIQPAGQLINHIEKEKQSLAPSIPADLPDTWSPWFKTISEAFQENRNLLETLEDQLDILKTTQLQLVQSEKMSALGNLVAGVAHEINNPVGFVSGNVVELRRCLEELTDYIQLLEKTSQPWNQEILKAREDLEIDFLLEDLPAILASMQSGCDRIQNISKSLRLFARSDDETKFKANVHKSIDSTLLILKYRLKANDKRPSIQVICNYGELPDIACFPGQLSQVFMNILANAVDMFDEMADEKSFEALQIAPQQITISTQLSAAQQIEIRIRDNGKGIPQNICDKIFDRKFTTKTVGKGTGLGLAISHQVITEKHHGCLEVYSEPGQGTEFLILLPVESASEQQGEQGEPFVISSSQ